MSSKHIVRQPIKDSESNIIGYEIHYHGDNSAFGDGGANSNEFMAANTIYNFLTANTNKLLKGALNFMTFTNTLLMKRTPALFGKDELVIQIDDSVIIHPLAMFMIKQYAKEGYKIAVNQFQFAPRYLAIMDTIDYIKMSVPHMEDSSIKHIVEMASSMGKICVAMDIDDEANYNRALKLGITVLEGNYVADKLSVKAHSSDYLHSNFFRLVSAVTKDDPDVEEITDIISVDATLTYGILKMANSLHFSVRKKVNSIKQAIVTVGLNELKQWVYLLSFNIDGEDFDAGTEELLRISLRRAMFCNKLMNFARAMPINRQDAYLMGMFSTLHYLIDAPMEEILEQLPITVEIKDALLKQEGRAGMLYGLIRAYEHADWTECDKLAEELGVPSEILTDTYFACVEELEVLWNELTNQEPVDLDNIKL